MKFLNWVQKFGALSAGQRALVARACLRLAWTALNLRLFPAAYLRRRMRSLPSVSARAARPASRPEEIAWAVALAARYVPGGDHCLAQALAGAALMAAGGWAAQVRLGVVQRGDFAAHAWVECEGRIVLGAGEAGRYASLPLAPRRAPSP